ncbi:MULTISPECIES: ANTAR domain-containing protein [Streptomyces]|uniref:ANTAR domain-containing protein n=2 Tax=Streptomyces TaxID=1883 RepID=A0ABW3XDY1_9ACTN|nr:ANTAR domain-containing protein [Streptomyces sp. NBC_01455]
MTSEADMTQQFPPAFEASADEVLRLEDENLQLKQAVRSHAVVDQAIGVILAVGRLTPDQGWDTLRSISQNTNVKLRHVAELIVEWARTGQLPTEIRSRLEHELGLGDPSGEAE